MKTNSENSNTQQWDSQISAEQYNYAHFDPTLLVEDAKLIRHPEGARPGDSAPYFRLKDTEGRQWGLEDVQGKPLVLVIGSGTCPITQGSLPGLKRLYNEYRSLSQWLMLYVREAHPGENLRIHQNYEQKKDQADFFRKVSGIAWPVLIDELDGKVHHQYGLLPNSVFLIDAGGKVSFVGEIAHAPTLRKALEHLFEQGMHGVVPEREDKMLHMLGPTAYGWAAIKRGGRTSVRDLVRRSPPLAADLWMGYQMKALLNPIAGRSKPMTATQKTALTAVAGLALWGLVKLFRR